MNFFVVCYVFLWLMLLGGCIEALGAIIPMTIGLVMLIRRGFEVENYDMTKVSSDKMSVDAAKGIPTWQIKENMIDGKYDKDK